MTDSRRLAALIHDTPLRFVAALAGGGADAAAQLLGTPGASRSVLEVVVPYAEAALAALLGNWPENACSPRTARAMALVCLERAHRYGTGQFPVAGLALTAALASDRPKRGQHRVHIAAQSAEGTIVESLVLDKGRRDRQGEEAVVSALLMNLVAELCGIGARIEVPLGAAEAVERASAAARPKWYELITGQTDAVLEVYGTSAEPRSAEAIFPGAFNPLHDGHRRILELAEERLGVPVYPEISVLNVDKPPLDYMAMEQRLRQFDRSVWFTRLSTFEAKAARFPRSCFVVGADTVVRIANQRYYADGLAGRDRAIRRIAQAGCRFLVFGRLVDGRFTDLDAAALPPALRAICDEVGPADFRADISSTEIRVRDQEGG